MTVLTGKMCREALTETNKPVGRPIVILSKFWMRYVAEKTRLPLSDEIDTGYIRYILSKPI